ncbi:MAG: energy transducer TonB [Myxococcales bacterium]
MLLLAGCATVPLNAPPEATCRSQRFSLSPGVAVVAFTVDADGEVRDIAVRNPDAPSDLVNAVKVWLAHCHFNPGLKDGKPLAVRLVQKFRSE